MHLRAAQFAAYFVVVAVVGALARTPAGAWLLQAETAANNNLGYGIVRLLGMAEGYYHSTHGRYGTIAELLKSDEMKLSAVQSSESLRAFYSLDQQAEHDLAPGFTVEFTSPPNGASFRLSVMPKSGECPTGWGIDNTGEMRETKPVGCEALVKSISQPKVETAKPSNSLNADDDGRQPTVTPSVVAPGAKSLLSRSSVSATSRTWTPPDVDQAMPPVKDDQACPLAKILQGTSERTEELVANLQRFSATERIEHLEVRKDGSTRISQNYVFNYVAQIEQNPGGSLRIDEYRSSRVDAPEPPLADTGTAAFALIFHPRHVKNFEIRCEGVTDVKGMPAWQVHFEETPDLTKSFHAIRISGSVYQLRFKGRAWISASDYQVLRLVTDLVAPLPQIELQVEHLDIVYAPVEFKKRKLRIWLPESATLYISYRGHRYERVHNFSGFQLFSVDTEQTVKNPPEGPDGL